MRKETKTENTNNIKEEEILKNKKMILDIVTVASKNRMTIPASVRDLMQLEKGDAIVFLNYENHIGMVKVKEEFLFQKIETADNGIKSK